MRVAVVVLGVLVGCGDDGGAHHPSDAPRGVSVTLSVDPDAVIASGETREILATLQRTGFYGDVTITPTSASSDLTVMGGTIAAGETSFPMQIMAGADAPSSIANVSVAAAADGVDIAPASLAVTIRGRFGAPLGGQAASDQFGSALAISADGKRVIVGAFLADANGADSGNARVFERTDTDWVQIGADLVGEAAGDRYGGAVAISNDGSRIAIGSYLNDGGANGGGNVRVFDLVGTTWTQVGADIDGMRVSGGQGWSLDMSATGNRLIIGAPTANSIAGTALAYELVGGAWTQLGATFSGNHELGDAVAMSDDGNRVAIGSTSANGTEMYTGKVDVYAWDGTAWTQLGASILGSEPAALCGTSVSLSADGSTLALGASQTDGNGLSSGEARVYHFDGAAWTEVGGPMVGSAGNGLGTSVSLSGDGSRVMVGGPANGGVARFYKLVGDDWALAPGPAFGSGSRTGSSVAISPDGHTAGVAAPYAAGSRGEVRLYDLP